MPRVRDTVFLSGWLFADLLLALAVLFLVANTAGIELKPVSPPILIVTPTILDANSNAPGCSGGTLAPQCSVTIEESKTSVGVISWSVNSDISDAIKYSISGGKLSPGQSTTMTISAIPCQNGSFTFNASRLSDKIPVSPVIVSWHCIPPNVKPERLDLHYRTFYVTVNDVNTFLTSSAEDGDIKQQIETAPVLQGESVGLAIVYGGAPDSSTITQAIQVSQKVYGLLGNLNQDGFHVFDRASFYAPLYTLGASQSRIQIDVFFFIR